MVKPVIELSKVSAGYGDRSVLKDVSFDVMDREIVCLLGPNGSGKTTILDCITGFRKFSSGEIKYKGEIAEKYTAGDRARLMASIPQHQNYTFPFSVFDMVCMGRAHSVALFRSPGRKETEIVDKVLKITGLESFRNRYFTELSGGEAQLVMVARALVQESEVFIMDEPTSHLDFRNELMVLEMIAGCVGKLDKTVVMATHFPNHLFYFMNYGLKVKVVMIKEGEVIVEGDAMDVLNEANLSHLYGVECVIGKSCIDNRMLKFLLPVNRGVKNEEIFKSVDL